MLRRLPVGLQETRTSPCGSHEATVNQLHVESYTRQAQSLAQAHLNYIYTNST